MSCWWARRPLTRKELLAAGLDEMRRTIREKEPARPSTRLSLMGKEELTTTTQRRGAEAPKLIHLLRGDLDWIVMKCLEKDRTRRYETANGLAADLKRHLNNEPVVARPPSTAYRLQKAWRRNKAGVYGGGGGGGGIGCGNRRQQLAGNCGQQGQECRKGAAARRPSGTRQSPSGQQAEKQERLRADAEKAEASHLLYVANMNLAQQAWDQNNIGRLRQLLEDTQDSPYRGFEWYYWQTANSPGLEDAPRPSRMQWSLWPFPRTASGLSPAVMIRRPRCGRRPAAGNCSRSRGTATAV